MSVLTLTTNQIAVFWCIFHLYFQYRLFSNPCVSEELWPPTFFIDVCHLSNYYWITSHVSCRYSQPHLACECELKFAFRDHITTTVCRRPPVTVRGLTQLEPTASTRLITGSASLPNGSSSVLWKRTQTVSNAARWNLFHISYSSAPTTSRFSRSEVLIILDLKLRGTLW